MILIGLGANLSSSFGPPKQTLRSAVDAMSRRAVKVVRSSSCYESAPVPASDQPWFVNCVVQVETALPPARLLATLQEIEDAFGRVRTVRNAPRVIDIDILDYDGLLFEEPGLTLPHPRMGERAFVLFPLQEVVPGWIHPVSGATVAALIENLPPGQQIRICPED